MNPQEVYILYILQGVQAVSNLLLKFKTRDTPYGVTRDTLRAIADELDVSETMAIHLALSRLATEVLPAYEMDEGPLTKADLVHLRKVARPMLPKGKVRNTRSLL